MARRRYGRQVEPTEGDGTQNQDQRLGEQSLAIDDEPSGSTGDDLLLTGYCPGCANCVYRARCLQPSLPTGLYSWRDKLSHVNSHRPRVGCVAMIYTGSDYGHVAYVADTHADGTITTRRTTRTKDASGNVARGDVLFEDSRNTLVYAQDRMVACVGLDDAVIVETPDAVLVARKDKTQNVKQIVAALKAGSRSQASAHRKIHRPWGWYDSIDNGARFQVKRIVVNPGARLSLQMHHHRAEHWIVVKGTAEVTNGEKTFLLGENESTYIPLGHVHRLANPGKVPLELIEVQSGSYLDEDDIVRFEDTYGRTAS